MTVLHLGNTRREGDLHGDGAYENDDVANHIYEEMQERGQDGTNDGMKNVVCTLSLY